MLSTTNAVILIVTAVFTVGYAMLTSRVAPIIAAFFARLLQHERRDHLHTLVCRH